jgi:hypothetical protein
VNVQKWETDMKLGGFIAVALLVLVTLVCAFPQVVSHETREGRSANTDDHMDFTRQLADHSAKLDVLKSQHDATTALPERMARIEERLDVLGRMVFGILGGIFALLAKEIWAGMQSLRSRRFAAGG